MPNKLQDKFDGFGAAPSPDVWSSIENRLDEKRRKKRVLFWWIPSGIVATLFVLGSLMYVQQTHTKSASLQKDGKITKKVVQTKQQTPLVVETQTPFPVNQDSLDRVKTDFIIAFLLKQMKEHPHDPISLPDYMEEDFKRQLNQDVQAQDVDTLRQNLAHVLKQDSLILKDSTNLSEANSDSSNKRQDQMDRIVPVVPTRKPWLIRANLSTWNSVANRDQELVSSTPSIVSANQNFIPTSNSLNAVGSVALPNSRISVLKPLAFSLQLARPINPRWLWFGGLNYDRLVSENRNASNFTKCTYNSVGISAGLEFQFLTINRFSLSSALIVNNDLFLLKSTKSNGIGKDYSLSDFESVKGFQNSLQLDLNFNFQVGKRSCISVKPGVRQYLFQQVNTSNFVLKRNFWYGASVGYTWSF